MESLGRGGVTMNPVVVGVVIAVVVVIAIVVFVKKRNKQ